MKTKKILGLGICALSLGMVAGVIGTRAVVEAKAGEGDITVYFRDATWWAADGARSSAYLWKGEDNNGWPGEVMSPVGESEGHGVWKATIDKNKYEKLIFARYRANDTDGNKDWGAKTVTINLSDFNPDKPLYDISGQTTAVWGDPGVTGSWISYEEPEPVEPTLADGYYILGVDGWDISAVIASDAEKGDNAFQKENISLDAGDAFKIVKIESDTVVWGSSYGHAALKYGTGQGNFIADEDGNLKVDTGKGGAYDIYLKDGEITINNHGELPPEPKVENGWYLAGTKEGSWAVEDCLPSKLAPLTTDLAQFHDVKLEKDTAFKVVYIENDAITTYVGYEAFENGKGASKMDGKIAKEEGEGTDFVVEAAGTYSIYLFEKDETLKISIVDENYVAGPTGYYLLQDPWTAESGTKGEAENEGNYTYFLDLNLKANAEFVIAYFEDGVRPAGHEYDYGWSEVSTEWSGEIAKFEAGENNHIKVKEAGVYSIYVSKSLDTDDNFVCLNATGLTPEVIENAKKLHDYIVEKGAESYAGKTEQQMHDACVTKYNKAWGDYTALGEAGQKYFRETYATEWAVLSYWKNRVGGGTSSYNISGLTESNPALIITISVIAGAAVAVAAIYLISKKRKHN